MRLPNWIVRHGRALAGLLLLATLAVGEVADTVHHLDEHGCSSETGGRQEDCTCASLHAGTPPGDVAAPSAPFAEEQPFSPLAPARMPCPRTPARDVPRAPPAA
jgi:hypothetical protein